MQAFEAICSASLGVINLLHLRARLSHDPGLREACHRAYWVCYLLQYELKPHVSYSTQPLRSYQDKVPLPFSAHDEPGMWWFLSEIALRKIYVSVAEHVGYESRMIFGPLIADELSSQIWAWYTSLPRDVKFPLGSGMLLDPRKAFLRGQFYSILSITKWPSTVHLLAAGEDSVETQWHRRAAEEAIEYMLLHIQCVVGLMQERHILLFANIIGYVCLTRSSIPEGTQSSE